MDIDIYQQCRHGQHGSSRGPDAPRRSNGSFCQQHHPLRNQCQSRVHLDTATRCSCERLPHQHLRQIADQLQSSQRSSQQWQHSFTKPAAQRHVLHCSGKSFHSTGLRLCAKQKLFHRNILDPDQGPQFNQSGQRQHTSHRPRLRRLHAEQWWWAASQLAGGVGQWCLPVQHGGAGWPNVLHRPGRCHWV